MLAAMRSRSILLLVSSLLAAGAGSLECAAPPGGSIDPAGAAGSPLLSQVVPPPDPASLHALLINGGGWHEINYRSHRQHLEMLLELLGQGGVDPARITVLASDGADPAPDLAIRDSVDADDLWLVPRAELREYLQPQMEYVNTELAGVAIRPATPAELERWFREEGSRLGAGDTLLLYVTDHGNKNESDAQDNTISLWAGQQLGVRQLQAHLDQLDPDVRVVMLMSQCFGGSFANAIFKPREAGAPPLRGNVCGYFATTAERPAYGCYPETSGREGVGHSQEVFTAWSQIGELQRAHRRTLVTDRTPDVPNTSRDFYLGRLMREQAEQAGVPLEAFVDRWLREAWKHKKVWEPELRLLDHVAHSFGLFSPRSLAELDIAELSELSDQLDTYADRWEETLEAARRENWLRFAAQHTHWAKRLEREALRALDDPQRKALRDELLAELVPFTRADARTWDRLQTLRRKAEDARSARYRTEVRIGALLRMRTLLTSIAGRTWLDQVGSPAQARDHERLARCEALALGDPAAGTASFEPPEPLPQLADDRRLIESVMPSWMGIRYQPLEAVRRDERLPRGAVQVVSVYPDSPAAAAGFRVADIVLGTPGHPFEEVHAIREWTMQSELGRPTTLELLRGGEKLEVTLVPGSFPLELPALPGPPKVGSAAPVLSLETYRGPAIAEASGPRLLFFWATWCGPCKQSLPELLAFAQERGVPIIAITDELPEQLDEFFRGFDAAFPATIVSDPLRASFLSYGVSGTPTFVLVDESGVIRHYQRGYSAGKGLSVEGWKYLGAGR
jgi:thiol-disulfide isomerase/thioredoxin